MQDGQIPLLSSSSRKVRLVSILLLLLIIFGSLGHSVWSLLASDSNKEPISVASSGAIPLPQASIDLPPIHPADQVNLKDDEEVVGISRGGKQRAYRLKALRPLTEGRIETHVVNDLIDGTPITVTYCDQLNCLRVFTDDTRGEPLKIGVKGWTNQDGKASMILAVGSIEYRQSTGESLNGGGETFPFPQADYKRTTWKEWKAENPNTDVYAGIYSQPMSADSR